MMSVAIPKDQPNVVRPKGEIAADGKADGEIEGEAETAPMRAKRASTKVKDPSHDGDDPEPAPKKQKKASPPTDADGSKPKKQKKSWQQWEEENKEFIEQLPEAARPPKADHGEGCYTVEVLAGRINEKCRAHIIIYIYTGSLLLVPHQIVLV